jgi:hypothetical protein
MINNEKQQSKILLFETLYELIRVNGIEEIGYDLTTVRKQSSNFLHDIEINLNIDVDGLVYSLTLFINRSNLLNVYSVGSLPQKACLLLNLSYYDYDNYHYDAETLKIYSKILNVPKIRDLVFSCNYKAVRLFYLSRLRYLSSFYQGRRIVTNLEIVCHFLIEEKDNIKYRIYAQKQYPEVIDFYIEEYGITIFYGKETNSIGCIALLSNEYADLFVDVNKYCLIYYYKSVLLSEEEKTYFNKLDSIIRDIYLSVKDNIEYY